MSWVLRHEYTTALRTYVSYFSGAGWSQDRTAAVRFGRQSWADVMLRAIGRPGSKVVRRRRKKPHRCTCACCPCLEAP